MHAARDVEVGGQAASRLVDNQLAAIARLADDFVACRQVDEQSRPRQGLRGADLKVTASSMNRCAATCPGGAQLLLLNGIAEKNSPATLLRLLRLMRRS